MMYTLEARSYWDCSVRANREHRVWLPLFN
jgi:hypothetical protein